VQRLRWFGSTVLLGDGRHGVRREPDLFGSDDHHARRLRSLRRGQSGLLQQQYMQRGLGLCEPSGQRASQVHGVRRGRGRLLCR